MYKATVMKRSYTVTISLKESIEQGSVLEQRLIKWMKKQDYSFGWSEASQSVKRHLHLQIWVCDKYKMPKDVKNYIVRNIIEDITKDEIKHGVHVSRAYDCWDKNYYESDKKADQETTQLLDYRPTTQKAKSYYDRPEAQRPRGGNLPSLTKLEQIYKEVGGTPSPSIGQVADFLALIFVKERRFDIPADPRRQKALCTNLYHFLNPNTSYLMFLPKDNDIELTQLKNNLA